MSGSSPPSLTGTRKVYLPKGSLGVVFTGTPPTVKEIKPGSPLGNKLRVGQIVISLIVPDEVEMTSMSVVDLVSALKAYSDTPKRALILSEHTSANSTRTPTAKQSASPTSSPRLGQSAATIAEATPNLIQMALAINQQSAVIRQMFAMLTDIRLISHEATINHLNQQIDQLEDQLENANRQLTVLQESSHRRAHCEMDGCVEDGSGKSKLARSDTAQDSEGEGQSIDQHQKQKSKESNKGWFVSVVLKDLRTSGNLNAPKEKWKDTHIPDHFAEKKLVRNVLELCSSLTTEDEVKILQAKDSQPIVVDKCIEELQARCMRQMLIYEGHDLSHIDKKKNLTRHTPTYISLGIRIRAYKKFLSTRLKLDSVDPPLQGRPPTPPPDDQAPDLSSPSMAMESEEPGPDTSKDEMDL